MKKAYKLIYLIVVVIQSILITGVSIIEHLTTKRAGVMRHVYHRRLEYESGLFSENWLFIQKILLIAILSVLIIHLIRIIKRKEIKSYGRQVVLSIIMTCMGYFVITSQMFIDKLAYIYFIIVFEVVIFIQIFWLLFIRYKYKRKK